MTFHPRRFLLTSATSTLCCRRFLAFMIRTMAASISCFLSSSTLFLVSLRSGSDSPFAATGGRTIDSKQTIRYSEPEERAHRVRRPLPRPQDPQTRVKGSILSFDRTAIITRGRGREKSKPISIGLGIMSRKGERISDCISA